MTIGIYYIINKLDTKRYIGYSKNIEERYDERTQKDWTLHPNIKLRRAAKKYGQKNFVFTTIEECQEELLPEREKYYCSLFSKKMLYNIADPGKGGNLGEEVNKKIKKILNNPDVKKRQSENTKIALDRPDRREKRRINAIETWKNPEIRKNRSEAISVGLVGHIVTRETANKIGKANSGKIRTDEHKKNTSKSVTLALAKPEIREKLGHKREKHHKWVNINKEELLELYNSRISLDLLAQHFNASTSTINRRLAEISKEKKNI